MIKSVHALLVAGLLAGCAPETEHLTWTYRYTSADQRDRTVRLEAAIRRGGCTSEETRYRAELVPSETDGMLPPRLPAGRWGFEIRAFDDACNQVGIGCNDVELPGGPDEIVVPLTSVSVPSVCPAGTCVEGRCEGFDAGPPPPVDAGRVPDAGPAPVDSGPDTPDAGPACGACPSRPHIAPMCYGGRCVVGGCETGWSDCDGLVSNGCEHEGPCECPDGGSCEFDCFNGCTVNCNRNCTVRCGECTTCLVRCAAGMTCTVQCADGTQNVFGGPFEVSQSCEIGETCG